MDPRKDWLILFVVLLLQRAHSGPTRNRAIEHTEVTAVSGSEVSLPCNTSSPEFGDSAALVLWYRGESGTPIYSVDSRDSKEPNHVASEVLGARARFVLNETSVLILRPVKDGDAGEYRCRVDFKLARTRNSAVRLTVIVPAQKVYITDSYNKTLSSALGPLQEGTPLTIICHSTGGRPLPSLTWYRGPVLLDDTFRQDLETAHVWNELIVQSLSREDQEFSCHASNTNLTVPVAASISLDLVLRPLEVRISVTEPLRVGKPAEARCEARGSRPAARLTWHRRGTRDHDPGGRVTEKIVGGSSTSTLAFVPTAADHGTKLQCLATNPRLTLPPIEDFWTLNVLYPPQVSLAMGASTQHQHLREGDDVNFECNVAANPRVPGVSWTFEGLALGGDPGGGGGGLTVRNRSLHIRDVRRHHRGRYACMARNAEGEGRSEDVLLQIQYAPVCRRDMSTVYGVARHETAEVECLVDADPPDVEFRWSFNSSADGGSWDVVVFTSAQTRSVASHVPRSMLDYGTLSCYARNVVGALTEPCVFRIVPTGPPESVSGCLVVNLTAVGFNVVCEAGKDGGVPQTFHLEAWGLAEDILVANISNFSREGVEETSPTFRLRHLSPGTTFRLVVYSSNTKGRSMPVSLTASTLFPAERRVGVQQPLAISAVLAVLIGLVLALVVMALAIIYVVKSKGEESRSELKDPMVHEKINPAAIRNEYEDCNPDLIPDKPYVTSFPGISPDPAYEIKNEKMYDNFPPEHTYENIIPRMKFKPKECGQSQNELLYAELDLAHVTTPSHHRPRSPATEYANISFTPGIRVAIIEPETSREESLSQKGDLC